MKSKNAPVAANASTPNTSPVLPAMTNTSATTPAGQASPALLADWLKTVETRRSDVLAGSVRWPEEMRSPFVRTRHLNEFNERTQRAEQLATKTKVDQERAPVVEIVFEPPTDWTLTATSCGTNEN